MSSRVDSIVARRNTREWIKIDPVTITLRRPTYVESEAGGKVRSNPATLSPQVFRITPFSGQVWDRTKTTPDEGRVADVTQSLVGYYDADVQQNDEFDWVKDGVTGIYKVVHVSPHRHYRVSATIEFRKLR